MNPMNVLAPNDMANKFANTGVDTLTANMGWGVTEMPQANPAAAADQKKDANPAMTDLRRAKAREYGRPMSDVGF